MKIFVLYSEINIPYSGTFQEIKGVTLNEDIAQKWVSEQPVKYHTSYDYTEYEPID